MLRLLLHGGSPICAQPPDWRVGLAEGDLPGGPALSEPILWLAFFVGGLFFSALLLGFSEE